MAYVEEEQRSHRRRGPPELGRRLGSVVLDGKLAPVLASLSRHRCAETCLRDEHGTCLVLAAKRYLMNHREYLNYPEALARNLPVGSGEAESAIRHIIRKRMDVAGAWKEANANRLLGLLTIPDLLTWLHEGPHHH